VCADRTRSAGPSIKGGTNEVRFEDAEHQAQYCGANIAEAVHPPFAWPEGTARVGVDHQSPKSGIQSGLQPDDGIVLEFVAEAASLARWIGRYREVKRPGFSGGSYL
jgi:hypothetical protein